MITEQAYVQNAPYLVTKYCCKEYNKSQLISKRLVCTVFSPNCLVGHCSVHEVAGIVRLYCHRDHEKANLCMFMYCWQNLLVRMDTGQLVFQVIKHNASHD